MISIKIYNKIIQVYNHLLLNELNQISISQKKYEAINNLKLINDFKYIYNNYEKYIKRNIIIIKYYRIKYK